MSGPLKRKICANADFPVRSHGQCLSVGFSRAARNPRPGLFSGAISRRQVYVVNLEGAGCYRGLILRKVSESRMTPTAGHLKITAQPRMKGHGKQTGRSSDGQAKSPRSERHKSRDRGYPLMRTNWRRPIKARQASTGRPSRGLRRKGWRGG